MIIREFLHFDNNTRPSCMFPCYDPEGWKSWYKNWQIISAYLVTVRYLVGKIGKSYLDIWWAVPHANRLKPIKQFPHQQLVELAEYTQIRGGCPQFSALLCVKAVGKSSSETEELRERGKFKFHPNPLLHNLLPRTTHPPAKQIIWIKRVHRNCKEITTKVNIWR